MALDLKPLGMKDKARLGFDGRAVDYRGVKLGHLVVIDNLPNTGHKSRLVMVQCDCGSLPFEMHILNLLYNKQILCCGCRKAIAQRTEKTKPHIVRMDSPVPLA